MKEFTPSNWDDWPTTEQLAELSAKANGLFHYAATALQWIKQQIDDHNRSCRGWVLDKLTQEGGLNQLEDLYKLVLTSFEDIDHPARNVKRRADRLAGFQHVIGTILVLHMPLTTRQIIALLDDIPVEHLDVEYFLQQLRSVLIPGTTASFEEATPQMHKSFRDYIMDGHAPAEFRILTGHAHFVTARSCLEVIVEAGRQSDVVVKYSIQHWYKHLRKAVEGSTTWEDERIWNLFELMVEEAVFDIWAKGWLLDLFVAVAAAGWGLLKVRSEYGERGRRVMILQQHANKDKMQGISNILIKVKVRGGPAMNGNCAPSVLIEIPLVPRKCMLFSHHPCLSCSLFLAFSSLGSACFSPITHVVLLTFSRLLVSSSCMLSPMAHVCLAHFFSPSCL
ncbi:hypothetical protein B0H14DRAFT_2542613 [Mycena olivaceomarginata]|nr:hypothetical protein B0H14DRAFT_2542613 [Mycena olivaceomarginata]